MELLKVKKAMFKRALCLLLCVTIVTTGLPIYSNTVNAAETQTKFVKADPEVFVPSAGEKAKITFNLESKRSVNIYVKDGKKVIANIVKNKEYKGGYVTHEVQWDGKDDNGNYVNSGTYKIIVEPVGKYSKYKSITSVSVVGDSNEAIYIAPNTQGDVFKVYGKGGSKQGIKSVNLSVKKNGKSGDSITATVGNNLWYAEVSMASYSLYDLNATIKSSSGTTTSSISAVMHTFRVTDRLEYLASAYYGDYKKDSVIRRDNGIYETYKNSGELVGSNLLIINPSKDIKQEITSNNTSTNQHLGIIDQLQRTASMNPVGLTMGNNFYENEDLSIDGYTPLVLSRSYNSMGESFHENGMNWTNSYTYFLQDLGNTIAIRFEDGHIEYYTKNEDGSFTKPEGLARELKTNTDGTYKLTVEGMSIYEFTANGKIKEIKDLNGNTTTFTYTDGLLSKIENISGYFTFTYNTDGTIKSVKDSGDREIKYGYKDGLLTSYTDAEGNKTTYSYDSYNRLNKVVSAEKVVLYEIVYDTSDRVTTKTIQGSTYTYSYNDKGRTIQCTEPNGNKITFRYTSDYRIESEEYSDGTIKYYYKEDSEKTDSGNAKASSQPSKKTEKVSNTDKAEADQNKTENANRTEPKATALSTATKAQEDAQEEVQLEEQDATVEEGENNDISNILELKTKNMNVGTGDVENNTLYPQFHIINTSDADIDLSDVTLRYYFTTNGEMPLKFYCDYASIHDTNVIAKNITGKFVKLDTPVEGADYYMEVGFTSGAGKLKPGSYTDIHTRIGKSDWSVFKPGDDYSQNTSGDLTYFDQVDMFYQGTLVWGKGSISGEGSEGPSGGNNSGGNNNGGGNNSGGGNNNGGNNSGNSSTDEEEIIPKGKNNLKLKMYNTGNNGSYANTIHPLMKLVNMGENMIKLSDVTIRYYYTADDDKAQNFWCDWSSAGTNNITGTFNKLEESFEGADSYLEIGFTEGASYIDIGATIDIHTRFAKDGWGNYDLTNDHSINPGTEYVDWKKVDVFVDGVKVWGEDLIPSEEEELEVEHMDYADSTYTPVRAEMYNNNRESRSNQISPKFRIYNTQDEPIKLSDLRLNYFYTADGPEEQIFEVDWAGIGSRFQTSISRNDITCEFTEVNDSNLETKCVADIGFKRDDLFINPGEYLELQVRIHRQAWTKYVQSNDFSLNPEGKTYEEWKKIAVFIDDRWAYGSIPLSYTQIIDPDPNEEEDTQYPVESKESYDSSTDKAGNSTGYTYDDNGNITSVVDAMGNTTKYTYNKWNKVTSVVDFLGNKTIYEFDNKGNCTAEINAMGYKTEYVYNSKGNLIRITKADGGTNLRSYDNKGNVISITDSNADKITYDYDNLNRVIKYTDGNDSITQYQYSMNGNVIKVIDPLGNAQKVEYNKDGKVIKEINQNGHSKIYSYDKITGLLSSITNELLGIEKYQYDTMGKLTMEIATDGGVTLYDYDLLGRIKSVTNPEGGKYTFKYDCKGNTIEEKDEEGNVINYSYDKLNRVVEETDALNNTTKYTYDKMGKVVEIKNPSGGVTKHEYDKLGNITKTTDATGNITKNTYNKVGLLESITDAEGNKTSYKYDYEGNKTEEVNALGNTTIWKYNKDGSLHKEIDANGNSTTYQYDQLSRVKVSTDPLGNSIQYEYDAVGNKISETDALGNKTSFKYDEQNNLIYITNPSGKSASYQYDAKGQIINETDPNGNITLYSYDKNGNVEKIINALGDTSIFIYDNTNKLLEEIDANGNRITYQYDADGNNIKTTDARGAVTVYEYDKDNNLTQVKNSLNQIIKYEYDYLGNVIQEIREGQTSSTNQITHYKYNKNGLLTDIIDSMGNSTTYAYNSIGLLSSERSKEGKETKYFYDKVGNLNKVIYSDNRNVSFIYDKNNNIETIKDWNGITSYNYNANGQVVKIIDANNQAIEYTWTKLGQKKSIKYPSGNTVKYTYDNNGNIARVTDTNNGITTYTYDALNQVKTKQLPNGVQSSYNYDKNGWLIKREENGREVSKQTYSYEYDKNGNRTKETKTSSGINETIRYVYDVLNQLISVTDKKGSRAYTFDEFNNRIQKQETGKGTIQYKYNNLNQLVETTQGSTVTTYDYDRRGNLEEVEENGDTIQTYTFDSTNKMSKAVISKDDKNGDGSSNRKTVTSKYTYDGVGNRINAKIETNGSVTSNTTYVVDPESSYNDIIMAKDIVSGKSSVFTLSDEVISVETDGDISYYINDEKHNVINILDVAGKEKTTIEYDEYGVIANPEVVSTGGNIFAYTGHVYDKSTKLYYAKARYYDAGIGRFVSEDSYRGEQEELLSLNLYIYVQNNPIKYIDPSGNVTRWEGIQAHKYLQIYFKYLYLRMHKGMSGWIEYNIDSKRFKKGKGRADIVLHLLKTNVFEIYEIKPFNTRQQIEGRKQLKSYIGALREKEDNVRAGITFNPNGLAIVCKWDKNKVIRYETHPSDPGMIYYRIIERNDKYKEVGTVYNTEKQITINYGQVLYEGLAMIAVASIIYLGVIYTVSTLGTGPIWTLPMRALLQ